MPPKEKPAKPAAKKATTTGDIFFCSFAPSFPHPHAEPAAKRTREEVEERHREAEREHVRWGKRRAEQEEELNERARVLDEREAAAYRRVAIENVVWPRVLDEREAAAQASVSSIPPYVPLPHGQFLRPGELPAPQMQWMAAFVCIPQLPPVPQQPSPVGPLPPQHTVAFQSGGFSPSLFLGGLELAISSDNVFPNVPFSRREATM